MASFPFSASCEIATICVAVKRLRLMVVSLQGDPARKLHLSHVSNQGKLTTLRDWIALFGLSFEKDNPDEIGRLVHREIN